MNLSLLLKKIPYLLTLVTLARKHRLNLWLVGGFLRDAYLKLKRPLCDFDFCVEKNAAILAREFAKKLSAKCIILDEEQESLRVILKQREVFYSYDFTTMRADTFSEDLALRDFSVNTLGVSLNQKPPRLIDYYQAQKDLKLKAVRIIREKVIADDPLRILRGFSLMANYNFNIEPRTLKIMAKNKQLIKKVSPERTSEELFKILAAENSYTAVKLMDKFKIIDAVIPQISKMRGVYQGAYHHLRVWPHSLEALRQFEILYQKRLVKDKDIFAYLNEPIVQGRRCIQILKLACLLHDIGKPLAKKKLRKKTIFHAHEKIGRDLVAKIGEILRFSGRETEMLKKLTFWHLRPGYLADQVTPTKRAVYRFFRDTQREGVGVILLSLADWRATRGPLTNFRKRRRHERVMLNLVRDYFAESKRKPLAKLVDGHDIMRKLKIKPSPLVGKILRKIGEEQALGKISTKTEAYKIARKILNM